MSQNALGICYGTILDHGCLLSISNLQQNECMYFRLEFAKPFNRFLGRRLEMNMKHLENILYSIGSKNVGTFLFQN